jgi:hypothetical protein
MNDMNDQVRIVIDRLPWVFRPLSKGENRWFLDIEGLHVWVKDYGVKPTGQPDSYPWWGWRVGRGGSPVGDHYSSRDEAMHAGTRVAQVTAMQKVDQKIAELSAAQTTLREVVVTL